MEPGSVSLVSQVFYWPKECLISFLFGLGVSHGVSTGPAHANASLVSLFGSLGLWYLLMQP